jgi:hypothetical protein
MAVPVILSALGPFYYGHTHSPYWRVIVWALACTVSTLWFMRASFKHTWNTDPHSVIGKVIMVAISRRVFGGRRLGCVFARSRNLVMNAERGDTC